jgi:hypothetical protein
MVLPSSLARLTKHVDAIVDLLGEVVEDHWCHSTTPLWFQALGDGLLRLCRNLSDCLTLLQVLLDDTWTATDTSDCQANRGLILDVLLRKRLAVFQVRASKDEALLVGRDAVQHLKHCFDGTGLPLRLSIHFDKLLVRKAHSNAEAFTRFWDLLWLIFRVTVVAVVIASISTVTSSPPSPFG